MDEQKRPSAWVYARIPGDYDGTMNSYKVCSMQALHDGCDNPVHRMTCSTAPLRRICTKP